ncbi:MAG: hypothetical protein B7Z25_00155 [Aerococcus viridans]|nr:MAG: hypothetical protein B7Z25_00155 [Aerococcus viridans]
MVLGAGFDRVRQEAFRFEPLEENELKARTLGFKDFSETQSNLPLGARFDRVRQTTLGFNR